MSYSTYLGDITPSTVLDFQVTFLSSSGVPTPITSGLSIGVYRNSSTSGSTAGCTSTIDFNGVSGLNNFRIDTSADAGFYSSGSNFSVVIDSGTTGTGNMIGTVVANFSINNRSGLKATVSGRTLDISATGEVGLDFDNIKNATAPTTLTNITVPTVTNTTNVTGNVAGSVASVSGSVGGNVVGSVGSVIAAVTAGTVSDKTGYALSTAGANAAADALLDRSDGVETSWTPRQSLRILLSALAAKLSGAATATVAIRDVGDTKDRITATVDADGNRSAVTYNKT
jgi:hypothetical protein